LCPCGEIRLFPLIFRLRLSITLHEELPLSLPHNNLYYPTHEWAFFTKSPQSIAGLNGYEAFPPSPVASTTRDTQTPFLRLLPGSIGQLAAPMFSLRLLPFPLFLVQFLLVMAHVLYISSRCVLNIPFRVYLWPLPQARFVPGRFHSAFFTAVHGGQGLPPAGLS